MIEELEGAQMSPEEQALKQEVSALELEKLRGEVAKLAAEIEEKKAIALKTRVDADIAINPIGTVHDPRVTAAPEMSEALPPPGMTGDYVQPPPPG